MKRDVMITVDSKQEHPNEDAEVMNFITEGTYSRQEDAYVITYAESEVTGLDGTTTTLKIFPDSITLIRHGNVSSLMVFEKGKKHTSGYNTEFGMIEVGVTARRLNVNMDDSGGRFDLEYVIEVNNQVTSFTTLNVKVQ